MDLAAFQIVANSLYLFIFFCFPDFCLIVQLYNAVPVSILSFPHISAVFIRNRPSCLVTLMFFSLCLSCLGSQMHNQQEYCLFNFFLQLGCTHQDCLRSTLEAMFPKHLQSEVRGLQAQRAAEHKSAFTCFLVLSRLKGLSFITLEPGLSFVHTELFTQSRISHKCRIIGSLQERKKVSV